MSRELTFGRILSIANVLGKKIGLTGSRTLSVRYSEKLRLKPAATLAEIHNQLIANINKFGPDEMVLLDMLGEQIAKLDVTEMDNTPLNDSYLISYYHQNSALDQVMGVEEAAKRWKLSPGYVKNLCNDGAVKAKRIGMAWVIDKNQPNPKKKEDDNKNGE